MLKSRRVGGGFNSPRLHGWLIAGLPPLDPTKGPATVEKGLVQAVYRLRMEPAKRRNSLIRTDLAPSWSILETFLVHNLIVAIGLCITSRNSIVLNEMGLSFYLRRIMKAPQIDRRIQALTLALFCRKDR